jgi:hypothetical protein
MNKDDTGFFALAKGTTPHPQKGKGRILHLRIIGAEDFAELETLDSQAIGNGTYL